MTSLVGESDAMLMHPLLLVDGAIRRASRCTGRAWAPVLEWRIRRRLERSPDLLDAEVQRSISDGIRYFEALPGLELTTIVALWPAFQAGLESRLQFLEPALQYYRSRFKDPVLRVIDKDYDPKSSRAVKLIQVPVNHPINRVMEKCVYADRLETGVDILEELSELEDGGYYGTRRTSSGDASCCGASAPWMEIGSMP